jgi:hypothetical protein
MGEPDEPLSLVNGVLSILAEHENAARHGGLHVHTMRRQLETAVAAYLRAAESGDAGAIAEAYGAMNRRAADAMKQIAEASMRLLREEKERAEANIAAMEREFGGRR